jgi:hypothetical protein
MDDRIVVKAVPAKFEKAGPLVRTVTAQLDLRPFQIADFRGPQTMPKGDQDQGRIAVSVATARHGLHRKAEEERQALRSPAPR